MAKYLYILSLLFVFACCGKSDTSPEIQTFSSDANSVFIGKEKFDLREVESIIVQDLNNNREVVLPKVEQDKLVLAWNHSKEMGIVSEFNTQYQIVFRITNGTTETFMANKTALLKHNSDYAFQLKDEFLISNFMK